jgi:hypothetical protein
MQQSDLLALSERLFNQLGLDYAQQDDGDLVIPTEDDRPIYVSTEGVTDGDGREFPVLTLWLPLLEEVRPDRVDKDLLAAANEMCPFGSVLWLREAEAIVLYHEAVGWPGAAEYRITLELLVSSAAAVEEFLDGRVPGTEPTAYSEMVS